MAWVNWKEVIRQCRAAGLKVVEISGWESRTRPGSHNPKGVVVHHTGGSSDSLSYVRWMALDGRASEGIPAPLCQVALGRDGTVYMCAAGRANQAGKTKSISNWLYAGDGNSQTVGIEAMNTGREGWGKKQYDAYVLLCAIICRVEGWPASRVVAHKETSITGKWDPGMLDMTKFRNDVAAAIGGTLPDTGKPKENGVSHEDVIKALKDEVGQGLIANAVAAALRDGPVVRREFKELVVESFREQELQRLLGNAFAAALRDGWVVRREMVELSEAGATKANQKEKN